MSSEIRVTDLEGSSVQNINYNINDSDTFIFNTDVDQVINFPTGWYMFGFLKQASSFVENGMLGTINTAAGHTTLTMSEMFENNLVKPNGDPISDINDYVVIIKDNNGIAYLPEFNFDGIGQITDHAGYQIKTFQPCKLVVKGKDFLLTNPPNAGQRGAEIVFDKDKAYTGGHFSMICFPVYEPKNLRAVLSQLISINAIVIAKNNEGAAFLPQWNFNGIGDIEPGKAYIIKFDDNVINMPSGDSFTLTVVNPNLTGGVISFEQNSFDVVGNDPDPVPDPDPAPDPFDPGGDGFTQPPIVDISGTITIKGDAIEDLFTGVTFNPSLYETIAIKERILIREKILPNKNTPGLEEAMEDLFAFFGAFGNVEGVVSTVSPLQEQKDNFSPKEEKKIKNQQVNSNDYYNDKYPFFTSSYRNLINSKFAELIRLKPVRLLNAYFQELFDICNFYIVASSTDNKLFTKVEKRNKITLYNSNQINNYTLSLFGDDPLESGVQGFSNQEAYKLSLITVSRLLNSNGITSTDELNFNFSESESDIANVSDLGTFIADSNQVINEVTFK